MPRTSTLLIFLGCLPLLACDKQQPAGQADKQNQQTPTETQDAQTQPPSPTAAAEAAIEAPEPEPEYEEQGGVYAPLDYLSFLMKQPAQAKTTVAQINMRSLGQAVTMHKVRGNGYPESLQAMVQAGEIPAKLTQSAGNPNAQIVYLRPTDRPGNNALLAFDPVGYTGGKYFILTCGGGSKSVSLDDLKAAVRAREGKVVQPELKLKK